RIGGALMRQHPKWATPLRLVQSAQVAPIEDSQDQPDLDHEAVVRFLDAHTLAELAISSEVRYLGDGLTNARRIFLFGQTGLGKTELGHAIGAGIASGRGFLDWETDKPEGARVLIIDGEMSKRSLKTRMEAAIRREGGIPRGNMIVFAQDRAAEFASLFPGL